MKWLTLITFLVLLAFIVSAADEKESKNSIAPSSMEMKPKKGKADGEKPKVGHKNDVFYLIKLISE
jgi:hypothetical protein